MAAKLWEPEPERADSTLIKKFMERTGRGIVDGRPDYDALWRYSVDNPSEFWSSVWDFCGIIGDRGKRTVVPADNLMDVRFFPDASLNYAENLLRDRGNDTAMVFHGERGDRRSLQSKRAARPGRAAAEFPYAGRYWRRRHSIGTCTQRAGSRSGNARDGKPGGRSGLPARPIFGVNGVLDRFGQIKPKLLFCAEGYDYNGKWFETLSEAKALAEKIPSIKRIVVLPYSGGRPDASSAGRLGVALDDYLSEIRRSRAKFCKNELSFSAFRDVLVGNHRIAQMHRAFDRWHVATAFEGTSAAVRFACGRPVDVLFDDGMDDVELDGQCPRHWCNDRALRRLAVQAGRLQAIRNRQDRTTYAFRRVSEIFRFVRPNLRSARRMRANFPT